MTPDAIIGSDIIKKMRIIPILDCKGFTFADLIPEVDNIIPFCPPYTGSDIVHPVTMAAVGASNLSEAQITCITQARNSPHLTPQQQHQLEQTLIKFSDTITDQRIGYTDVYQHEIKTGNHPPISCKPYKASPEKRRIINNKIQQLLDQGVLQKSNSPWASPVFLTKKGPNDHRLVIDARRINKITTKDAYPPPTIENIVNNLSGNKYFTKIDLAQAFNQVSLHPSSRPKSAIITEDGLYEFTRVGFGGKNSGAIFQRVVDTVLSEYKGVCAFPYCDDIIVYSKTFSDHLRDISNILTALQKHGLTACPKKSIFAQLVLKFLGLMVTEKGIKMDPERVQAIKEYARPRDLKKLSKFLGFVSWYAKFVRDLSEISHPLNNLKKAGVKYKWSVECEIAFNKIKDIISEDTLLHFPNFNYPFYIQTDASDYGIGAFIFQIINSERRIIAFASKTLTKTERYYCTSKKEALAAIWACEKWQHYVDYTKFFLISDHSALKYLFSKSPPTGQNARWVLRLQNFDFEFLHKPGKDNIVPDVLSREPLPLESQNSHNSVVQ